MCERFLTQPLSAWRHHNLSASFSSSYKRHFRRILVSVPYLRQRFFFVSFFDESIWYLDLISCLRYSEGGSPLLQSEVTIEKGGNHNEKKHGTGRQNHPRSPGAYLRVSCHQGSGERNTRVHHLDCYHCLYNYRLHWVVSGVRPIRFFDQKDRVEIMKSRRSGKDPVYGEYQRFDALMGSSRI